MNYSIHNYSVIFTHPVLTQCVKIVVICFPFFQTVGTLSFLPIAASLLPSITINEIDTPDCISTC